MGISRWSKFLVIGLFIALLFSGDWRAAASPIDRVVLIYNGQTHKKWPSDDFDPYVSYLRQAGKPMGWLFHTFLFLPLVAKSGNCYYPGFSPTPSNQEDWRWYLDEKLFGGENDLANLEASINRMQRELGGGYHTDNVVIAIPYPDTRQVKFDAGIDGVSPLNFSQPIDRRNAVRWYVQAVIRRWKKAGFHHLHLSGFYWLNEDAPGGDKELLQKTGEYIRHSRLGFYWIPYFHAEGARDWRQLGFNYAFYQPNFFFNKLPISRIEEAATFARKHRMGMEIECDGRFFQSDIYRRRFCDYLNGGIMYGYMRRGGCALYEGGGALLEAYRSHNPIDHALYDETALFFLQRYKLGLSGDIEK